LLQWLGVKNKVPVIVAPRGEFFAGARSIKKIKKNLFIKLSRFFNLYHNVIWQASSEMESFEINKIFSFKAENSRVMIARNVSGAGISNSLSISSSTKFAGTARIVFISRISPIKNLDMAIQILSQASGKIVFDIYGPQVDIAYWNKCLEYIAQLPPNITARYCGELSHNAVSNTFSEYDAFLFPTGGENFGHVIVEALSSGCPVIISDRTSWNHIASQNVGYVVPLDDITGFITAINNIINMDNQVHQSMRLSAKKLGLSLLSVPEDIDHNRDLFLKVLNSTNKQY
jgi:glycosyltransferase involved in cell wall biosynthesis